MRAIRVATMVVALVAAALVPAWNASPAEAAGLPTSPGQFVDIDLTPSETGYWMTTATGEIAFANAPDFGSRPPLQPGELVSGLAPTPTGAGYWLFSTQGRVFPFGDAGDFGDIPDVISGPLNGPIIDAVATPTGQGYYLLGFDGGIFAFGDAEFHGSIPQVLPGVRLGAPIVGLAPTPSTEGYWLVGADGGVFAFGDAGFVGSLPGVLGPGVLPNRPVIGMIPQLAGGYLMLASDGGIFSFGQSRFLGSLGDQQIPDDIVAVAVTDAGDGYVMADTRGRRYGFGILQPTSGGPLVDAPAPPDPGLEPDPPAPNEPGGADLRYVPVSFRDPLVNGIVAFTVLVPEGWEYEGGIEWQFDKDPLAVPVIRVTNPATGSSLRSYFVPTVAEGPFAGPFSARGLAVGFAQQNIPHGTITQVDQIAPNHHRVRVAHVTGGRQLETDHYLSFSVQQLLGNNELFRNQLAYSITAPAGSLDAATPFFLTVASSASPTPEWTYAYVTLFQNFIQGLAANRAQLAQLSQQIQQNNDEINQIIQSTLAERSASQDRIFADMVNFIRGEDRVQTANGSRVIVPNSGIPCQVNGQQTILIVQSASVCPTGTTRLPSV